MGQENYTININDTSDKHIEVALNQLKTYRQKGLFNSKEEIDLGNFLVRMDFKSTSKRESGFTLFKSKA